MREAARRKSEFVPIVILIVVCSLIGIFTVKDFGESWDEPNIHQYAEYAIQAYRLVLRPDQLQPYPSNLNYYGPWYVSVIALIDRAFTAAHSAWQQPVRWHFSYFVTFLIGVLLLYLLSRRWLGAAASLGASLLLVSQPLLWGHAFMNPKDPPYMTFFLASVYVGLVMVDRCMSGRRYYLWLVLAGILLGLTISFRPAGPLAGLLVGLYALSKSVKRSILLLLAYGVVAVVITYLSWPFLWGAPLARFIENLQAMANFPFSSNVLFMGVSYGANQLPWYFYPVMLGIQLTLLLLLLAVAGLVIAVRRFFRPAGPARELLVLFVVWFLLPVIGIMVEGSTLYDNGRQLFFLLPPVFLLAGLSLEALFERLRGSWLRVGVLCLIVIPGLYGAIRLHPYEYVYYNELVGGTGGAYGRYEMDYWGTSYQEAGQWLNEHAAAGSTIWVTGPDRLLKQKLRGDFTVPCSREADCGGHHDYIVTLARWNDEHLCPNAEPAYTVEREGAILTVIKRLPPGQVCQKG